MSGLASAPLLTLRKFPETSNAYTAWRFLFLARKKRIHPAAKARRTFEYTLITRKGPLTEGIPKNFCASGHPTRLEQTSAKSWGLFCATCNQFASTA
jgi:hypothetical protein